ncbi:hypothetical protein MLD38_027963 [Melastoma candidum]|uniref:Uncharacterized protein n=1 Tax=Melastoma candidum TaxID=119954 RepID=A0ACB9MZE8_9MYRT|nr:hypothetical protein MLD38_027963 [Melastoma candidum]
MDKGVKLYGTWYSPYAKRVELALKLKGIDYEYVEEDLQNKSQALLVYNPVYKKVPVLVHHGRPLVESAIILEYVDETWTEGPRILPADPYKRAQVRFWSQFVDQQLMVPAIGVLKASGEARAAMICEFHDKLKVLEEGIKDLFLAGHSLVNGETMGFLDVVMCSAFGAQKIQEEVIGEVVIDPEKYPVISSWLVAISEQPVAKALAPPREKVVHLLRSIMAAGI